jgi:hypothetical protein
MRKIFAFFVLLIVNFTIKAGAQGFDSAKIYSLCLNRTFYTRIDREYIKFSTDTVFGLNAFDADSIYAMFQNRIKSTYIKTLSTNHIDIRMSIDFYKQGKAASNISVLSGRKLTINNKMYSYEKSDLKLLNAFIPDLSKRLCID